MKYILAFFIVTATSAHAERLVSNLDMCALPADDIGQYELGAELTATEFREIEYHCAWEPPVALDWQVDRTQSRAGYCEEPGYLEPDMFVIRSFADQPGLVLVYQRNGDPPIEFRACPAG